MISILTGQKENHAKSVAEICEKSLFVGFPFLVPFTGLPSFQFPKHLSYLHSKLFWHKPNVSKQAFKSSFLKPELGLAKIYFETNHDL